MPSSTAPTRVKVGGPSGLVAAVPYLLGFHPAESLVLLATHGPRRRIGFVMRLDLANLAAWPPEALAARLAVDGGDGAILVVVTEAPDDDGPPHAASVAALEAALTTAGLRPMDALLVRGGRWRSYHCADPACCPPEGTPVDPHASPAATALAVEAGRAVLPDRAALERSVGPCGPIAAAAMAQAVGRVTADLAGCPPARSAARTLALLDAVRARYAEPPAEVSHDEAARILVGLLDVAARDEALLRCVDERDDAGYALLPQLCRLAPVGVAAPVCTLLGAAAYSRGDGALTRVALERALAADPGYRMAELLLAMLDRQVPPKELRRAVRRPG